MVGSPSATAGTTLSDDAVDHTPLDAATLEALRGILPGIAALSGELNRPQRPGLPRRIAARLRAIWRE